MPYLIRTPEQRAAAIQKRRASQKAYQQRNREKVAETKRRCREAKLEQYRAAHRVADMRYRMKKRKPGQLSDLELVEYLCSDSLKVTGVDRIGRDRERDIARESLRFHLWLYGAQAGRVKWRQSLEAIAVTVAHKTA